MIIESKYATKSVAYLCKASTNFGIRNPKLVIQQVFTFQSANMVGYYFEVSLFSNSSINFMLFGHLIKWQLHCLFFAESLFNQKGRSSAGIWQRKRNSPEDR